MSRQAFNARLGTDLRVRKFIFTNRSNAFDQSFIQVFVINNYMR